MTTKLHGWTKNPRTRLVTNTDERAYRVYQTQLENFKKRKGLETRISQLEAMMAKLLDEK